MGMGRLDSEGRCHDKAQGAGRRAKGKTKDERTSDEGREDEGTRGRGTKRRFVLAKRSSLVQAQRSSVVKGAAVSRF